MSELKPITPEEQEIFDRQRFSKMVIQNKCTACGAWYETDKRDKEFVEQFLCDCGAAMSFTVPPLEITGKLIKADTADVLAQNDTSLRLDTGMTAQEAIMRAKNWWETKGRTMMRQHAKRQKQAIGGSNNGAGSEFASQNPDSFNFLPAGFIHAKPWDELDAHDQQQLVKVHHHFNTRKPELLDEAQATHKMQDRGLIQ